MKTYKEMIWELALNKAHRYYSGGAMMSSTEQEETVAWIFEVSLHTVHKDVQAVFPAACDKVSNG
jgi:hypothetical protein